jgi:hypothetical protein
MGAAVAGTTLATEFRPKRSYTTLWDVTLQSPLGAFWTAPFRRIDTRQLETTRTAGEG